MSQKQKRKAKRVREIRKSLLLKHPLLVLMYKGSMFSTSDLNDTLPSSIMSLLLEFEDVLLEDIPSGLPPIRGIED
ncbi:Transposon Ty3-I Gag-Pol polyprotein [Gossypium australe]|uniref:Transposon Ty3-I Gag-Pol polyprotein n=1 Tax=Gossypium australe TaxID=47621 RepID=A0A5B6WTM0_9ROSI|nr:Transposon Ty3-I Gag-Pol polyprotein [Gossypium australe]